jgi:ABC-2 type transport system permease protein
MNKYLETIKVCFKAQLAFRFDIFISMLFTISKILLAYVLWGAIFGNQKTVAGFTFHGMLSYYIISSFLVQLDQSSSTGNQIASEIRNGLFSKYMVKPMSIFGYFTAQTVGVSAFFLSFNLFAALLWILVFRVDFIITHNFSLILTSIIMCILGLLFLMQLNYFIGILAFKFVDTWMFMMIKDNIVQFIIGSLLPLAILPAGILAIMKFFPFYYASYLPTMLLMGKNNNEIITGMITLTLWNTAFWLLNTKTYNRLRLKFDGVGI